MSINYGIIYKKPNGQIGRFDKNTILPTHREALMYLVRHFSGCGWTISVTRDALDEGFEYELLTFGRNNDLERSGWFLRIQDL